MKREILFRGKKESDGEWIYGDLLWEIHDRKKIDVPTIHNQDANDLSGSFTRITAETVGQFTGLTDKNGVKIFEDDVLRWPKSEFKYLIKHENGAFICFHIGLKNWDDSELKWGGIWRFAELGMETEVIGNIHENPELLKT